MNAPLFPLLPSLVAGFRHLRGDWLFIGRLIAFPILVMFGAYMALDLLGLGNGLLWSSVFKVPGDFVKGIFLALYTRHLLFQETPAAAVHNTEVQRDLAVSTLIYTALSFFFSGIAAALAVYTMAPEAAVQSAPLMVASVLGLAGVIWLFRYQWLPIAAAAGYSLPAFLRFLGYGFALPIRIMALWFCISVPSVFILGFAGAFLMSLGGAESLAALHGPPAWLFFLINAALSVVTSTVVTAASVHAIRHGMKGRSDV